MFINIKAVQVSIIFLIDKRNQQCCSSTKNLIKAEGTERNKKPSPGRNQINNQTSFFNSEATSGEAAKSSKQVM